MAEQNLSSTALFSAIGVPAPMLQKLAHLALSKKVQVSVQWQKISILVKGGPVLSLDLPVPAKSLLTKSVPQGVKEGVCAALVKLLAQLPGSDMPMMEPASATEEPVMGEAVTDPDPQIKKKSPFSIKIQGGKVVAFSIPKGQEQKETAAKKGSEAESDKKVPLLKATKLLQPVGGTDAGSVYHAVAFFDGLSLAARHIGTTLSMRVEGEKVDQAQHLLLSKGWKSGNGYVSIHLSGVTGLGDKAKVIGSVISELSLSFDPRAAVLGKEPYSMIGGK